MINIGTTDFYLNVPSLPVEDFKIYSTQLFDEWEDYVGSVLKLSDYYLALNIEEGSISAKSKILVGATALCGFLASYGAISSGVKSLYSDVSSIGDFLGVRASAPFADLAAKPIIRKRGEALSKLESLFVRVGNGSISVDEAVILAEKILGEGVHEVPEFMDELKDSLEKTPSQMLLPIEESEFQPVFAEKDDDKKPRVPKPKIHVIRPEQYRIEIWRESKQGQRNVRVRKI